MFCGYDSAVVLREDLLDHIRQDYKEIAEIQKRIDEIKKRLGIY